MRLHDSLQHVQIALLKLHAGKCDASDYNCKIVRGKATTFTTTPSPLHPSKH